MFAEKIVEFKIVKRSENYVKCGLKIAEKEREKSRSTKCYSWPSPSKHVANYTLSKKNVTKLLRQNIHLILQEVINICATN